MLRIFLPNDTPRMRYALHVLLCECLGADYALATSSEGAFTPDTTLLERTFAAAVELPMWENPQYSPHGRYELAAYPHFQAGNHRQPYVHHWAEAMWDELLRQFPNAQRNAPQYDFRITWDIDIPFRFLHKPAHIQAGLLAKNLLRADWEAVFSQLRASISRRDPHDTFAEMMRLSPPEKTVVFLLLDRHSAHDTRHTYQNTAFRRKIAELHTGGYTLGIHPSYSSFLDEPMLKFEVELAQPLGLGSHFTHSRQHFLKYRYPDTFRYLHRQGVQHEYSLAMSESMGFRTGMARAYNWYDVERETETALRLHPAMFMDRTALSYLRLSPTEAVKQAAAVIAQTRAVGGTFSMILHNDSLSESGEWRGWSGAIREIIAEAQRLA